MITEPYEAGMLIRAVTIRDDGNAAYAGAISCLRVQ